ncbi:MAG: hypothetical protein M1832_004219 [Thelocarpon impressellum]|nr:MAG: hypothetical protein M1832_004219 [Thelocarpon impressellum]
MFPREARCGTGQVGATTPSTTAENPVCKSKQGIRISRRGHRVIVKSEVRCPTTQADASIPITTEILAWDQGPFPNHADAHAEQKQDREAQTWPKEKEKRWQQELGWIRPSETSDQIEPPSLLTEGSSTESSSESLPTLQSADRFPALSSGTSSPKVWTISNLPFVTVEAPCTAMLRGTWTARNAATRVTEYAKTVTSLVSADCGYCMYAETPSSSPAVDGAPTVTTRDWAIFTSVICQPYTPILPVFTGPTATSSK